MAITRYQGPFSALQQLDQNLSELTNRWFGRRDWPGMPEWPTKEAMFAPVDIETTDGEIVVKLDVPGAKAEDLKIDCNGDMLTISGERKAEKSEKKGETYYSERQYGSFMRRVALPATVKQDAVKARYKDGVLEVHLPKSAETKTKAVKIETG